MMHKTQLVGKKATTSFPQPVSHSTIGCGCMKGGVLNPVLFFVSQFRLPCTFESLMMEIDFWICLFSSYYKHCFVSLVRLLSPLLNRVYWSCGQNIPCRVGDWSNSVQGVMNSTHGGDGLHSEVEFYPEGDEFHSEDD